MFTGMTPSRAACPIDIKLTPSAQQVADFRQCMDSGPSPSVLSGQARPSLNSSIPIPGGHQNKCHHQSNTPRFQSSQTQDEPCLRPALFLRWNSSWTFIQGHPGFFGRTAGACAIETRRRRPPENALGIRGAVALQQAPRTAGQRDGTASATLAAVRFCSTPATALSRVSSIRWMSSWHISR